jgi:hypothetical protein
MALTKTSTAKGLRRSVTLPREIVNQVEAISKQRRLSDNRVLVELIEQGIQSQKEKEKAFFELAHRFREAHDPKEVKQLGDRLGRFVFGELQQASRPGLKELLLGSGPRFENMVPPRGRLRRRSSLQ